MSLSAGWYYVISEGDFNNMLNSVSDPLRATILSVFTPTTLTDSNGTRDVRVCLETNFDEDWWELDPDGAGPYNGTFEDLFFTDNDGWPQLLHPVSGGDGGLQ